MATKVTGRGWIYTNLKNDDMCIYSDFVVQKNGVYYVRLDDKDKQTEKGFLPMGSVLKVVIKQEA